VSRIGSVLVETYRIERLIAEGSMGSVYEARHLRIPKRFAVKFLRLVDNAEAIQRFRREAEMVATLEHPHIVSLLDYNVGEDGVPYIVLEYLDGEDLGGRLRRQRRQPLRETLRVVAAVGEALTLAHGRDIIHRDLKPDNIVITSGGVVKVVDFGVAKLRGAPELTAVNTVVGTVPYMAPEQLMGGRLDARVDQYALGTIAYEMLAGEMAFDGSGTISDVARRVLTGVPPFIAGVPQAVNEAIFRAMSRTPGERFASVAELVTALQTAAGELAAPAVGEAELPPLAGEATRLTTAREAATLMAPDARALLGEDTEREAPAVVLPKKDEAPLSAISTQVVPAPLPPPDPAQRPTAPVLQAVTAKQPVFPEVVGALASRRRWLILGAAAGLIVAALILLLH
jgi:serine/threonine protein kinase